MSGFGITITFQIFVVVYLSVPWLRSIGRARLIGSHSSARISFELSGNSN